MPTFSTIALENLLEPRVRDSYKKPLNLNETTVTPTKIQEREAETTVVAAVTKPPVAPRHIIISPALYATPKPAPIPETLSEPLSPSPYVVNHKRRGCGAGTVGNRNRRSDGVETGKEKVESYLSELVEDNFGEKKLLEEGEIEEEAEEEEEEGFLDSRCETVSVGSANEMMNRQFDCRSFVSAQGEFFDAIEDFSSDNVMSNASLYANSVESELRAIRVSLLEEIEMCKNAEEALNLMHSRWQRISNLLCEAGLAFPRPSNASGSMQCDNASMEEFAQEVVFTKFVVEAIGKSQARAEAEVAAEAILESKDQEISRLRDRLQYYEAVNREMSQRNQEIIDGARKQRQRRKKSQKVWFWSCLGLSVGFGLSFLAYSYLPQSSKPQKLPSSCGSSDASSTSSFEAA